MKRTVVQLACIVGLTLLSQNVKADTLVGPGGAFRPWTATAVLGTTANPKNNGFPYWNNLSGDGPTDNIGWCMVGTGGCIIASPPGAIAAYITATGGSVQNMIFQNNGIPVSVSLLGLLTNQLGGTNGYDLFGWYEINANGSIGKTTVLWNSGTAAVGANAVFTPAGNYGLFLENIQGNGQADYFWFMNSSQNSSAGSVAATADSRQHFAVFSGTPGQFLVGIDDTNNGDGDFNDMILKVTNVPEPRALFLLSVGLLLGGFRFSKRQQLPARP
jgi:hypothetical protein